MDKHNRTASIITTNPSGREGRVFGAESIFGFLVLILSFNLEKGRNLALLLETIKDIHTRNLEAEL